MARRGVWGFGGTSGQIVVELALALPALIWAYLGMVVYWDAFLARDLVQKAAYTAADALSRANGAVDPAYLDGLGQTVDFLILRQNGQHGAAARLRISQIRNRDQGETGLGVDWSYSPRAALPSLTDADLAAVSARIPALSLGTTALLVEVEQSYTPAPNAAGVKPLVLREFLVTRPRFQPQICLGQVCG